ncbi:MAG: hypothetical protein COB35_13770 [Gammaproteobacteria bacterium]|nr:MAG: hypothetical protein COB35_13770 [Gammaproteobacteria bacterium]
MKFILFVLLFSITTTSFAMDSVKNRQEKLISQLLTQQVSQNISIKNSVSSLITLYPEKADIILKIALGTYPRNYKDIIIGTIQAEPALSASAVSAALQANVAQCKEVVEIAINAEPAYANEIIQAALKNSQDPIQNIVRVAVSTEPFISNSLLSNAKNKETMLDILIGAIKAIPNQVVNLVKTTLQLFPDQSADVIKNAINSSHQQFDQDIVKAAMNAGVEKELAIAAAIKGGANRDEFAKL